jgi:hypothetical protein
MDFSIASFSLRTFSEHFTDFSVEYLFSMDFSIASNQSLGKLLSGETLAQLVERWASVRGVKGSNPHEGSRFWSSILYLYVVSGKVRVITRSNSYGKVSVPPEKSV